MNDDTITVQASPIFQWLEDNKDKRYIFCYGGAGSGKSTAIIMYLIKAMLESDNLSILVTRRTMPSLKMTSWRLMLEYLEKMCPGQYQVNKSDYTIYIGSNDCQFKSMDDEAKIRSLSVGKIFIEECSELSISQWEQLKLRLRKESTSSQQLIMATNPLSVFSWPYQQVYLSQDPDIAKHHSTYKSNPFLSEQYIKDLLKLKGNNKTVYLEGNWGKLEGLIFTDYEIVDKFYDTVKDVAWGLDFGYVHETALSKIHILESGKFYAEEKLYEKGLTNQELIRRLEDIIIDKSEPIFADPAEPARIAAIAEAGFNIHKANKDVSAGLDYMIENMAGITTASINLRKELATYSWQLDANDNPTPKPVKQYDHLIDSIRYACFTQHLSYTEPVFLDLRLR